MAERALLDAAVIALLGLSLVTAAVLSWITAPYGRYRRRGWGRTVSSTVGWVLMEAPATLMFAVVYRLGERRSMTVPLVFLGLWETHYLYRSLVYPFLRRGGDRPMPLVVIGSGAAFNVINASLNARWLSHFGVYQQSWLGDPRFALGLGLFVIGFAIHVYSDRIIGRLRRRGEHGYQIPQGGLFRWISCPNYLGEIIEWAGWALASWSPPALAFAVFTVANLAPRALAHHRWYRQTFGDYPRARRALVPFLY